MARVHALSIASATILLTAFVLLLLVSLSLPIIKGIYILDLKANIQPGQPATTVATDLRFGVWGVCAYSAFDQPSLLSNTGGDCFGPMLGYTVPADVLALTGYPSIAQGLVTGVTVVLVIHPIATGLSFITAIAALLSTPRRTHGWAITSLVLSIVTALATTGVFVIDLVLIGVAKAEVPGLTNNDFVPGFGPVAWLMLAGSILTWIAIILESIKVCGCCGVGRHYRKHRHHEEQVVHEKPPATGWLPWAERTFIPCTHDTATSPP